MLNNRKLGWIKDLPDNRDYIYTIMAGKVIKDASPVDLRPYMPPVRYQGQLGACTAFGATSLVHFARRKQKLQEWAPAPLFTYYTTRQIENTVSKDAGAMVRDALKSAVVYGVVPESKFPYIISKFATKPLPSIYTEAEKHQALPDYRNVNGKLVNLGYYRLIDGKLADMLACLAEGYPFMFGMSVYPAFVSTTVAKTGIVPAPGVKERTIGGHCMTCVGWKLINNIQYFIVLNSWGVNWGDKGYCYIPFSYMSDPNQTNDLWTIRLEEA